MVMIVAPTAYSTRTRTPTPTPTPTTPIPKPHPQPLGESIFEWKAADFGPRFGQKYPAEVGDVYMPEGMLKFLAVSEPLASCAVGDLQARVKGMIAIVERGECGFLDKVVAVQKAGAVAVVIMNTGEGVIPMMADPSQVEEQELEVGRWGGCCIYIQ